MFTVVTLFGGDLMKYLVTGGAGFIGSHVVDKLLEKGEEVVILDNMASGKEEYVSDKVQFVHGDIMDEDCLAKTMKGIDYVIHLAAALNVGESVEKPEKYIDINVKGTLRLLEAAKQAGVKKVVCASSASTYGDIQEMPLHEEMVLHPISPYGATKYWTEHLCHYYTEVYGLPTLSLRFFNVYGPRQSPDSPYAGVISIFADKMLNDEQPLIFGDGTQVRDYIYGEDVATACVMACEAEVEDEAINIATGKGTSVTEVYEAIKKATGKDVEAKHVEPRAGDPQASIADVAKAKELLGFKAEVSFEDGIKKTIEWIKNS